MFDGHAGIDAAKYLEQHLYRIFDGLLQKHTGGLGNALRLPHLEESGLFTPLGLQRLMNDLFEKVDAELIKTLSREQQQHHHHQQQQQQQQQRALGRGRLSQASWPRPLDARPADGPPSHATHAAPQATRMSRCAVAARAPPPCSQSRQPRR